MKPKNHNTKNQNGECDLLEVTSECNCGGEGDDCPCGNGEISGTVGH